MNLANYINDLLYRYDCVIVPNFGGFVTNKIGAKINSYSHTFTPPTKQISFNNLLKHNDGLLANYVASAEKMSFEQACTAISLSVTNWQNELQSKFVTLENLGILSLSEDKKIVFEPNTKVNYLTASFGLTTVASSSISRYKQQAKPFVPIVEKEEEKRVPLFIKIAATAAILLTLSFAGYNGYQNKQEKETIATQEKILQKKIQTATFVISNPLPTIRLNVVKEISKPYHIVAGAFKFVQNAEKKVKQLQAKGYDAKIIGVNKWGLTQVSFSSYSDRNEATNNLYKIQKTVSKGAWLLIKK
ncbi:SPOR domain-containing protein [uncultured Polaribacter sp.]|uniref:HU domain-containing protein n=1 Tax=uncultured Polaribacter sp. TaxID=174711 RepID=UPI0026267DD0|nr:SPOR domain-containing protein [uncultured Polaribacter sp.]